MQRQLDQLRLAAGELSPNDFLALASGLALVAATLGVAVIGMNLHWWKLSRDALSAQITETLLSAFPKTTTVLDPPAQMRASSTSCVSRPANCRRTISSRWRAGCRARWAHCR